ncbi:MAG: NAD(P)/FAD-dependent oxidoreductase [Desulfobacterales bacterium]|nr:NAD(P)/FAD-dependent oxidoreductase [Desulfobacterales bacterium]
MSEEHVVIIGNGPAGNQAAMSIRENDPEIRITLISRESGACCRPHLFPDLIAGKIPEEALYACPIDAYQERGIKLRTGQEVVGLNPAERVLILDHKEVVRFSGLIIAVGGKPRIPEPLLVFQDLMFTLKTLRDAKAWKERLSQVERVLIMGGDLTSLALTRALIEMGKKITFMFNEDAFWPLRCDDALFEEVGGRLSRKGVEVLANRPVKSIARKSEKIYEIEVDGRKVQAGMIGAFFGLVPDVRFLAGCGLRIDRGILVDEYLNTGFEGVYATGDCAQIYHPEIRNYWVSIGHDNAVALGHIAAQNLTGGRMQAVTPLESIFEVKGIKVNTSWWMEF